MESPSKFYFLPVTVRKTALSSRVSKHVNERSKKVGVAPLSCLRYRRYHISSLCF